MTLKETVERVLENRPETRNNDVTLTVWVWHSLRPDLFRRIDGDSYIRTKDLYELPREDNVKRLRAQIQNDEGRFLPTDPEVIKLRRRREERWRDVINTV